MNLKGVGVGNGLTDPVVQYQYYPAMAMNNRYVKYLQRPVSVFIPELRLLFYSYGIKTVSEEQYQKMLDHLPACTLMGQACQSNADACESAYTYCNLFETTPYYNTGLNPYDIRVPCGDNDLCYNLTNIDVFLNLESTRKALHVSDEVKKWESCNNAVNAMFAGDWMRNYHTVSFFFVVYP